MLRKLFTLVALTLMVMIAGCGEDCIECPKESPVLYLSKHKISFGTQDSVSTFVINNKGKSTMAWTVSISPTTADWLSVSQITGSGDATVTCRADRSKLAKLGISRASLIINALDAVNTTRDSVEVYIAKASDWLIRDAGTFDSCATVTANDYYWVKEFHLPDGVEEVVVDSISFNFCSGGEDVQLLAYDWTADTTGEKYPGNLLFVTTFPYYPTQEGWNTYPVDWLVRSDTFYLGFFQLGVSEPVLNIDRSPGETDSTGCWTAHNYHPHPDSVALFWDRNGVSKTFAIRAHISPAFQYVGKVDPGSTAQAWIALEQGYSRRGTHMPRVCPLRRD
jgi:hypothetical protein